MSKKTVIENIQKNIKNNELNKKVEVNDPVLSDEERDKLLNNFYKIRKNKLTFKVASKKAHQFLNTLSIKLNSSIKISGMENLDNLNGPAIVTSNHFNPKDNMAPRKVIKKRYKKDMYVVSQDTNLALPGFLGYLINYLNIIPLSKSPNYIIHKFKPELKRILDEGNYVLIYPEEEMWYNYRKPRPCKRGAYQFAAEFNVPIISCFVKIIDTNTKEDDEFNKVKYHIYVLKPIYPDTNKSIRENAKEMQKIDYEQKVKAYEMAYNKKLDYSFSYDDIGGLKKTSD